MFRWFALVVLAGSLLVSAIRRRQARRATGTIARGSEPLPLILGRLVIALPLIGSAIAYVANPALMSWSAIDVPPAVRWGGVVLGAAVVPGVYWVLTTLGANVSETVLTKSEHRLVTTGPYRYVRHPLYSVGIALFLSIGMMAANLFMVGWTLLALAAVRIVVIPREEGHLVAKFDDRYREYCRRTGALLPRWKRPSSADPDTAA